MKEYIDRENLRAVMIALDVAVFLEAEEAGETEKGNEVLSLAEEIRSLAERCGRCRGEEKINLTRALSEKVKYFSERCKEIASASDEKDTSLPSDIWRSVWKKSEEMMEGVG